MTQHVDPHQRKQDFLEAALALFKEKGYEKTTINDIINVLGVSKGAFYHYFQSKEDVIEEISDHYASHALRLTEQLTRRTDLNPIEKLNHLFQSIQGYKKDTAERRSEIKGLFRNEENLKLERKIVTKLRKEMAIHLEKIIQEGVEARLFPQVNPKEMTTFLQFTIQGLNISSEEMVTEAYGQHPPDLDALRRRLTEKLDFYEQILAQLFQVSPGTIQLKSAYLERFLEQ